MMIKTIFTGIQPTGKLHLGNYFGALKYILKSQKTQPDSMRRILCIADLHSLTRPSQKSIITQSNILAATIIACGIDPERTILFRQSDVLEHTNLMWLLMNNASAKQLQRMIQWKVP